MLTTGCALVVGLVVLVNVMVVLLQASVIGFCSEAVAFTSGVVFEFSQVVSMSLRLAQVLYQIEE